MSTTKRPAPRTPEGRPSKRMATSSPEEGELEDFNGTDHGQQEESTSTPTITDANGRFKVPFPFKSKNPNSLLSRMQEPPQAVNDRRDRVRGRSHGWERDGQERNGQRPSVVYERSAEDERRFRQEEAVHGRERNPRGSGKSRRDSFGDHYEPPLPTANRASYYKPRDYDPGRDREYDRREREYESAYSPPRSEALSNMPASVRSPTRSDSPRSPSRGRSPSGSASPRDRRDRENDKRPHRLPTPRSKAFVASPQYDGRERYDSRGDHYEPRRRDSFRDRDYDPRGQYYREEIEDYDRHYRPMSPYEWNRGSDRPRYSRSPAYRPSTPPRPPNLYDAARSPTSFPLPPPFTSQSTLPEIDPETASSEPVPDPETLLTHEAVSFALRRPGAPLNVRSPPSVRGSSQKATPAPQPVIYPRSMVQAETPATGTVRPRRMPMKRSREEEKSAYQRIFLGCGFRDDYEIMTKLGEGTFGEVHKGLHKQTHAVVALKRILMHNEKEGMPVTALREIKILKALKHPCIVDLLDMIVAPGNGKDSPMSVYMVFPYMDHDLAGLLENERVKLSPSQIKLYMKQLLEGTEYMHHNNIVHRDMKAANLLISNNGSLKIADFGLARAFETSTTAPGGRDRRYTNCVVTRWYRPPELLLGARQYGGEIDIWGIGCVLGEMIMRRPILPGNSDLDQLDKIWSMCGSPNQQNWPDYDKLPGCEGQIRFKPQERRIKQVYDSLGKETCDLLDKLLTLYPRERITSSEALDHEYFWSDPLPADPKTLPSYEASHEFDQRGRRQQPVVQNEAPNPPIRHGLPPSRNRNVRNEHQHNQGYRPSRPAPYGPPNVFNGPVNNAPLHSAQYSLPPPHLQNAWMSAGPRNAGSWGPSRPSFQGPSGPVSTGLNGRGRGFDRHQSSQLPPRPVGLPIRPAGLPPPVGKWDTSSTSANANDRGATFNRGGPGGGGLNYG